MKTFVADLCAMLFALILGVVFFFDGHYAIAALCAVLIVLIYHRIWSDES